MIQQQTDTIADALFSKTQQRVLALLFVNPERSFYTNEIVRQVGSGKGAVTRELTKLLTAGLVTLSPQGNQQHYQANTNSPVFSELHSIAIKTFGVVNTIKSALEPLLSMIEFACIYGSIAKGEAHASSDIDLLVISDDLGYMQIQELLQSAETTLDRPINTTLLTFEEFNQKGNSSFLKRVMDQPKLIIKDW
jgi:predicted nucleotidyltransferase